MAEKIEFISAANLPEATGDEVSVLCVEGGELKQKSGASLGGGVGGYMLKPTAEEVVDGNKMQITSDCTDMVKAIEAGASVYIRFAAGALGLVVLWAVEDGILCGLLQMFNSSVGLGFPNAPIPSCLQE